MRRRAKRIRRRDALTLIELLVVIAIILAIAALAAAFAPRVSDSTNLARSVDSLEQWLLTAKMRAKRDGLATGLRFIPDPGNPQFFSEFQYIQQPDPLCGAPANPATGAQPIMLMSATGGTVTFSGMDFTENSTSAANALLVQAGDYLEVQDGGVYFVGAVPSPTIVRLSSPFGQALSITTPTTNFRFIRQPRLLVGESPLTMPNNFAVDMSLGGNVQAGPSGFLEILFSPTGSVVGTNAGNGKIMMIVHDTTQTPFDPNQGSVVAIQTRTGFIGAYQVFPGADLFVFAEEGRTSGL